MIDVTWDEEETILNWQMGSPWSWTEFNDAIDRTWDMVFEKELEGRFDLIIFMNQDRYFPTESMFASIGRGMREISKRDGVVVLVTNVKYHEVIVTLVRRGIPVVGGRLYATSSIEAARDLILEERASKVT